MFVTFVKYPFDTHYAHGATCHDYEMAAYRLSEHSRTYGSDERVAGYIFDAEKRQIVAEFQGGISPVTLTGRIFCAGCDQDRGRYSDDSLFCMACEVERQGKANGG